MINHLPDRLDLLATAEAGRELRGRLAVRDLKRLTPLLASDAGELLVEMTLGKDPDGTCFASGTITGSVELKCQRCLEIMSLPLDLTFRLGLVQSDAMARELPDWYEPLVVTSEPADVSDLVAEEVLLAIPIVPAHEGSPDCQSFIKDYVPPEGHKRENPFAVLAGLKSKQS